MDFEKFIALIPKLKTANLPGRFAHEQIMDLNVRKAIFDHTGSSIPPKQSSVLCLVYPGERNQSKLAFILRKINNGHHSGQIGFPGGKKEKEDFSDYETALREAHEEIGIDKDKVVLIKKLSHIFIPVSNYSVNPFLAMTQEKPDFIKQEEEVEKILDFEIENFIKLPKVKIKKTYYGEEYTLHAFQSGKWLIWGATAMILSEIIELIKQNQEN